MTLTSADTARSVTWRGAIAGAGTTLPPISFDLIFYGSNANLLPDENNILSSTTVSFAAGEFTDTGFDVATFNVYEFRADLTPTALPAATRVWFSVLADTGNDADDNFHWTSSASGGASSFRADVSGDAAFVLDASGPFYFILDNALIPEPAGLSLLALAALPLRRRRR